LFRTSQPDETYFQHDGVYIPRREEGWQQDVSWDDFDRGYKVGLKDGRCYERDDIAVMVDRIAYILPESSGAAKRQAEAIARSIRARANGDTAKTDPNPTKVMKKGTFVLLLVSLLALPGCAAKREAAPLPTIPHPADDYRIPAWNVNGQIITGCGAGAKACR